MSGIRGLLGFHFWVDNDNRIPIEAMLQGRDRIPKDRREIMRDLETEQRRQTKNGKKVLGFLRLKR